MQDLILPSYRHLRFEKGILVHEEKCIRRTIYVKNQNFSAMFGGQVVNHQEGLIVVIYDTRFEREDNIYPMVMQPKMMRIISDTPNKIELDGICLKLTNLAIVANDSSNYSMTLWLANRNVVKATLHIKDRGIEIEYIDIH